MSAFDRPSGPPAHPSASVPSPNRPTSLCCTLAAFRGHKRRLEVAGWGPGRSNHPGLAYRTRRPSANPPLGPLARKQPLSPFWCRATQRATRRPHSKPWLMARESSDSARDSGIPAAFT